MLIVCDECGKEYPPKGIATHKWRTHGEGIGFKPTGNKRVVWNKGLTKDSDVRVAMGAEKLSVTMTRLCQEGKIKPPLMSVEQRQKLSQRQSLHNSGGKSRWYEVNGQKVQGRWERDFALMMLRLDITWIKPKIGRDIWRYTRLDGVIKSYTPDFFLEELSLFIEIKGFWWGADRTKMKLVQEQFPERKIKIIERELYNKLLLAESKSDFLGMLA